MFDIEGVCSPVFTPFDSDGNLSLDIIPDYAEYLCQENIPGILVGGTTGETSVLNLPERKALLAAWIEATKPLGIKVISQVGAAPIPDVLALAEYSQGIGADAILSLPELYHKPKTVEKLVEFMEVIHHAAPSLPLLYYDFPMMSGVELNMKQFVAAATVKIPTFKGLKADLDTAMQLENTLESDQRVFIANPHHIATSVLMCHDSFIATVANLFPKLMLEIIAAMKCGDLETARIKQKRMNRIVDTVASFGDFVPAMKATMVLVTGLDVGPTRKPVLSLQESQKCELERQLRDLNVL